MIREIISLNLEDKIDIAILALKKIGKVKNG